MGMGERIQALRFWEALDAFATGQEPAVAAALTAAVQALRDRITDAQLVDIIGRGDVDALLDQIDFEPVRFAFRDAMAAAADRTPQGFTAANGQTDGRLAAEHPGPVRHAGTVRGGRAARIRKQSRRRAAPGHPGRIRHRDS
jgi:hypothetical protein